jgi:hypothetical protein
VRDCCTASLSSASTHHIRISRNLVPSMMPRTLCSLLLRYHADISLPAEAGLCATTASWPAFMAGRIGIRTLAKRAVSLSTLLVPCYHIAGPRNVDVDLTCESKGRSLMCLIPKDILQLGAPCRCCPPWSRRQKRRRAERRGCAQLRRATPASQTKERRTTAHAAPCVSLASTPGAAVCVFLQAAQTATHSMVWLSCTAAARHQPRSAPGPQTANAERHDHSAFTCGLTWHAGALSPLSHARSRPTSARIEQRRRACRG